jgi:hypothetical protein
VHGDGEGGELDVYEVAFICGGPVRVAQTALVGLYDDDRIHISSGTHEVIPVDRFSRDLMQVAVLTQIPDSGRRLGPVVGAIAGSATLAPITDALEGRGLLQHTVMGRVRLTRAGRALRRRLEKSGGGRTRRFAAQGVSGLEEERLRRILETPDPKPLRRRRRPRDDD